MDCCSSVTRGKVPRTSSCFWTSFHTFEIDLLALITNSGVSSWRDDANADRARWLHYRLDRARQPYEEVKKER
jgi:hypothetical protein